MPRKAKRKKKNTIEQQPPQATKRSRGQQRGSRGHGRTQRPDLPVIEEHHELSDAHCTHCGLPYSAFPGAEESEIVEVEVKAYRRKIFRKRYIKSCSCPSSKENPQIIVAPPAPKIIPKSPYGISIWVYILLAKFLYAQPLHRILRELSGLGLPMSSGSMTGGLQKIAASALQPGELHEAQRSVLVSLQNHWYGLIIFLTHPEVPMDNNIAERAVRNPVIGRKNYYGSGSIWSAELAAMMFSQLQTIELWQLNPRHCLQEYLIACAEQGGIAPADLTPFLPWRMSEDRRRQLAKPPSTSQNTS